MNKRYEKKEKSLYMYMAGASKSGVELVEDSAREREISDFLGLRFLNATDLGNRCTRAFTRDFFPLRSSVSS
jgi:hypothetical protein